MDSMSLGMLTNNKIAGFAPHSLPDGCRNSSSYVSAKVSVKQFFSGAVNEETWCVRGIVDGLLSAEDARSGFHCVG